MIETREIFTSISSCTTLLNKTGTWRTQRPLFETKIAPCQFACPAGSKIPEWLGLVKDGDLQKAWEVIIETNPLIFVCGCVCPHFCEAECNRGKFDEALSIRSMERFLGKEAIKNKWFPQIVAHSKGTKVAIIGSGPAGLTASYCLAKSGYSVTVFEQLPEAGGWMRVGIPEYRLPKDVLNIEIERIQRAGVRINLNTKIESIDSLFEQGYEAVFLAVGAHRGSKMLIEGENSPGVVDGATFLKNVNLGAKVKVGDRVAVIGGGNVAIDSARTAIRLGAKQVKIIYRRSREEMPAIAEEIEMALEEGIDIVFLASPVRITQKDGELRLTCIRMELGEPDTSGRRQPMEIKESEFNVDLDTIIAAIGQVPDIPAHFNLKTGRGNTIQVDDETLATSREGVWAGGDVVSGPATVIEAIAAGRKVAFSIDSYLKGEPLTAGEKPGRLIKFEELNLDYFRHQTRQSQLHDRLAAVEEAKRCFSCGHCNLCGNCCAFCPDIAVSLEGKHCEISYDYCKGCGICVEECPTKSLYLKKE